MLHLCYRPARRAILSLGLLTLPVAIAVTTLYLIWHLDLLALSTPGGARRYIVGGRSNPGGRFGGGEAANQKLVGEIGKHGGFSATDKLHQRVVADLLAKCQGIPHLHGNDSLPDCGCIPTGLVGRSSEALSLEEIQVKQQEVMSGGEWRPPSCSARQRLCILVPYRNRSVQLESFLNYIHVRLQRQEREYRVFIIEQSEGSRFNRGLLLNVGFQYATNASRGQQCDCVVLHDVDMFAEDDRNLYMCPVGGALHMAAYRRHLNYSLPYVGYFGGITAVNAAYFKAANGYSNLYFGWGSEDDEFLQRLFAVGAKLMRPLAEVSRVTMLEHKEAKPNRERLMLFLRWKDRWATDGLSSLQEVIDHTQAQENHLHTWLKVEVDERTVKDRSAELRYQKMT